MTAGGGGGQWGTVCNIVEATLAFQTLLFLTLQNSGIIVMTNYILPGGYDRFILYKSAADGMPVQEAGGYQVEIFFFFFFWEKSQPLGQCMSLKSSLLGRE